MKIFVAFALSLPVLAHAEGPDLSKMGPWTRAVTKKDDKGVDALYKAVEEATKKGDVNAMAELNDYPIHMSTDNQSGKFSSMSWSKDEWIAEMKPFFTSPMPKDMKHSVKKTVHFNSETVATVIEEHTQTMGKQTSKWIATSTVIQKDGKWLFKQMFEAGWGGQPDTASAKK